MKISLRKLTLKKFLRLDYVDQLEIFDTMKVDHEVVCDLIRDRNEFRRGYYQLAKQLRDLGIEPNTTSYLRGI